MALWYGDSQGTRTGFAWVSGGLAGDSLGILRGLAHVSGDSRQKVVSKTTFQGDSRETTVGFYRRLGEWILCDPPTGKSCSVFRVRVVRAKLCAREALFVG